MCLILPFGHLGILKGTSGSSVDWNSKGMGAGGGGGGCAFWNF